MPELPEIYTLASQMAQEMTGEVIDAVDVRQDKCLNVSVPDFASSVIGASVAEVRPRGKWIFADLSNDRQLLINLGMGAEVRWEPHPLDEYQVRIGFVSGHHLCLKFWWFGHVHVTDRSRPDGHAMTADLGPDALSEDLTPDRFCELIGSRRGQIKPLLQNQKFLAGIGNVYVQDILFEAGIHPQTRVPDIAPQKLRQLYDTMRNQLTRAVELSGIAHERDLYGEQGKVTDFLVAYRDGQDCPRCGTQIEKLRVGASSAYVCPTCQPRM